MISGQLDAYCYLLTSGEVIFVRSVSSSSLVKDIPRY